MLHVEVVVDVQLEQYDNTALKVWCLFSFTHEIIMLQVI